MSEHLPECPQFCVGKPPKCRGGDCTLCDEVDCFCDRLRACEDRIWDEAYAAGFNHGRAHRESRACSLSYKHWLDAVRQAVRAIPAGPQNALYRDYVLEAINTATHNSART